MGRWILAPIENVRLALIGGPFSFANQGLMMATCIELYIDDAGQMSIGVEEKVEADEDTDRKPVESLEQAIEAIEASMAAAPAAAPETAGSVERAHEPEANRTPS